MNATSNSWMKIGVLFCLLASAPARALPASEPELVSALSTTSDHAGGPDRSGRGMIQSGAILTLEECVQIALRENPNIAAATGQVGISRSRVGQARAPYYPQVTGSAGYTRTAPASISRTVGNSASVALVPSVRYDQYSGSVTLNQTILDFRRWPSVTAAKYNLQSSRAGLFSAENDVVFAVKQAYYRVLQAKRNRDVAEDVIRQFELHLEQAKGFYEVGTRARIDVIKAEVDLSNAKLDLINTENALKIAWVNLNNAMGVPDAPVYSIEDNLSFQPFRISVEEAIEKAFQSRQDLQSLIFRTQAAEASVRAARAGHWPVLSGNASYSKAGIDRHPNDLNEGWSAGVLLTVPLFNGFLVSSQTAEAKSEVYVQKANEESLRQQILLEVRQAYLNLEAAEASIGTVELAVQQAKENLDLANGRYEAGVGSPVEVSDAFATYVTTQANYTGALADYKIAKAAIENAMGMK